MQLAAESDIDRAIAELKLALPVVALQNIVAERRRQHKPVKDHRRILQHWKARQIMAEADVD